MAKFIIKLFFVSLLISGVIEKVIAQQPTTSAVLANRSFVGYVAYQGVLPINSKCWLIMQDSTRLHINPLELYMDSLLNQSFPGSPQNFLWINPSTKRFQWSSIDSLALTSYVVTSALGYTPYDNANPSGYHNTSGVRNSLSVTTTGTTGPATYNSGSGVFNIPQYAGTVSSVGITSSDITVGNSPITSTGNMTLTLADVVSAGSANNITYNAKGQVTAGSSLAISPPVVASSFTSGVAFQPRSGGSCGISVQSTLSGIVGVTGTVVVATSSSQNGTYTNVSSTRLLISVLGVTADMDSGVILVPSGYWVKITLTGGVTATYSRWDF